MMEENEALRAQVAMLREVLQFVGRWEHLHVAQCAASISTEGECQCHVAALAATESDATAWLERQRKQAAAEALETLSADGKYHHLFLVRHASAPEEWVPAVTPRGLCSYAAQLRKGAGT